MNKKYLPLIFFPSILATMTAVIALMFLHQPLLENNTPIVMPKPAGHSMFMAVPKILGTTTANINTTDGTSELICQYLAKYQSPMAKTCQEFSQTFRQYNIDPVFALAIAQCESNLGKKMPIPVSQDCHLNIQPGEAIEQCCHNPFGWGVHSAGTLCFSTWEEGYAVIAKGLRQKYFDEGLASTEQIMSKYNKISAEERNGSWGQCVNQFIDEIKYLKVGRY